MATRFNKSLENFTFPKDIKNDLVYCQRTLRAYINVHQMIVDQYPKQKQYAEAKQACLADLENEIFEINCEQQYILVRVRRIIDEFYKKESRDVDRSTMNEYISHQIIPMIQNSDYICVPTTARCRFTESQLIDCYFQPEIKALINNSATPPKAVAAEMPPQPPPEPSNLNAKQVSLLKPISLLKPMSERVVKVAPAPPVRIKMEVRPPPTAEPVLEVPSKVNLSRMNLRQALSKAAAAINVAPPSQHPVVMAASKPKHIATEVVKKVQMKQMKSEPSSSEESVELRMPSPLQLDTKTLPDDYNQESFLRLFQLYTKDQIQLMQQRRSKRKRRSVHNNEKADFHYGRIDHMLPTQPTTSKRRKKEFLVSPRVNRAIKKKRSSDIDRSTSSSPEEKIMCNECLKRTGILSQCKECMGNYHELCHKETNIKLPPGQCPSCARIEYNAKLQQKQAEKVNSVALQGKFRELEQKLTMEKNRRELLQQESKMYKIDMRKLFNIVDTMKSDENDS